jgi:hypothetical protein
MKKAGLCIVLILLGVASVSLAADLIFTEGNTFSENGSFKVMGFVKNTSGYTMTDIRVTIKFYDKAGNFLRFETTTVDPPVLRPGEEASYRVAIPEDKQIASIKKIGKWTPKGSD